MTSRTPGAAVLTHSEVPLPKLYQGKVRDIYEAPGDRLLLVASDRVSAFDVVMAEPIPRKGEVLTQISAWWLHTHFSDEPHHLIAVHPEEIAALVPEIAECPEQWAGRAMLVQRTTPVLIECVVRGYISGSAWKEYAESGTLAGEPLPDGLVESDALTPAIFSPATKAQEGHDENIGFQDVEAALGRELADELRRRALGIYARAKDVAAASDIILADTKFEFGVTADGSTILIDEVLTPDSSRFWPKEHYATGRGQPSLDKQPIRDYLESLEDWDKQPPPPPLPAPVIQAASARYLDVFRRLTGVDLDDFVPPKFQGSKLQGSKLQGSKFHGAESQGSGS